ncbi:MAG: response regulator [Nitrosomonas sp.]|jgi:CheY-like chemotaxis protein|nr:response regulator [Nitrosomonas sp.]
MDEIASARMLLNGTHILLIEDNPANQMIARHLLEMVGCRADCADNGQQAMEKIIAAQYDLVVMDVQMPVMNGYETARRIRSKLKFRRLPIIAMTANATQEDRQRCLDAGMDDFIAKPIYQDQMYLILAKWLPDKKQLEEIKQELTDSQHNHAFININALRHVLNNDNELVRKFSRKFIQVAEETLSEIETAKKHRDIKSMGRLGHKLKSSARTLGAHHFAELCDGLEIAGADNDWQQAEQLSNQILASFEHIKRQIEQTLLKNG